MNVAEKHKVARRQCLAMMDAAMARSFDCSLDLQARFEAAEQARVYAQMADLHLQTILSAESVRPGRFTARNSGQQGKTALRIEYLRLIAEEIGTAKAAAVAATAIERKEGRKLWPGRGAAEKIERFMKRHKMGVDI